MVKVTFRQADGEARVLEVPAGHSLREAAMGADVPGILGLCGGFALCSTCHVYVAEEWIGRLPPMDDIEDSALDGTVCDRLPNSRLSCQLTAGPEIDGIVLEIPARQL
jgi:2Fe-2S ferredoxin